MSSWEVLSFEFSGFEWNNEKAESNWHRHGIDFEDAAGIFRGPVVAQPQSEKGEDHWKSIGLSNGRELTVIFTERKRNCRLISSWRSTRSERKWFYAVLGG